MGTVQKYKPKHVRFDPNNPEALGVCDYTGFTFNHKDLVKQMEWSGNNLVWTGFLVGRPYVDIPNEQSRPPIVKVDPRPIKDSRLPENYVDPDNKQLPSPPQLMAQLQSYNWGWDT